MSLTELMNILLTEWSVWSYDGQSTILSIHPPENNHGIALRHSQQLMSFTTLTRRLASFATLLKNNNTSSFLHIYMRIVVVSTDKTCTIDKQKRNILQRQFLTCRLGVYQTFRVKTSDISCTGSTVGLSAICNIPGWRIPGCCL